MYLHNERILFKNIINATSNAMGIPSSIVEKDYYVFIVLNSINNIVGEEIIFKGGTSLSKAYGLVQRFSEDIDLCLLPNIIKSSGSRKRLVSAILSTFESLGMEVSYGADLQRRGDYNKILGGYESVYNINRVESKVLVESCIIVETAHRIKEYPYEVKSIDSYIGQYIRSKYGNDSVSKYELDTFNINTISVYRTFVDKLFAIADYYMLGKNKRYSRHLYDLYKIINYIDLSDTSVVSGIQQLLGRVRIDRQASRNCVSAQQGINLSQVIMEALSKDFYKDDYNNITSNILYEKITYEECKYTILKFLCLIQM